MSKVIIHIGPHKTGSSFIQAMMRHNFDQFPPHMQVYPKGEFILKAMVLALKQHFFGNQDAIALVRGIVDDMARNIPHEVLLISDEDILGSLPSRGDYKGLYIKRIEILAVIQSAFRDAGHDVQFVFYLRNYDDWLESLYRYKFIDDPNRPFAPKRFKSRNGLPDNWLTVRAALTQALGDDGVTFINYQDDRTGGRLGTTLFKLCGMSQDQIDALNWIEPVNVSRPKTVDPANW